MRQLFDLDSPLMNGLSRIADLAILNILFLICCIPVITIGPALTAMYYVTLKMVKNEECYIVKSFFKSFFMNFKQGLIIWLFVLAAIFIIATDFKILNGGINNIDGLTSNTSGAVIIVLLVTILVLSFIVSYVFPVLSRFDNTVLNTIKNSLLMSLRHLPFTILIILVNVIPVVLAIFVPPAMIILVISFALSAYVNSFIFVRIFNIYTNVQETVPDEQFTIDPEEESFLFKNTEENSSEDIKEENVSE